MITPLKEKLFVNGYQHPCYTVKDKTFYSKPLAIKYCTEVGWEWPTFQVWKHSQKFTRPKKTFEESLKTQCELISDTCDKVRLFYSGGRDSGLILDSMLKYKSKLDEIAVYRRYPGKIDNTTNEWDKFNLLPVLKNILKNYNRDIPIKFYDILPEHWSYYSKNLDKLMYGHFTNLGFFRNSIHTVAEIFPKILENNFVNILGECRPDVTKDKKFYWTDLGFNVAHNDPNTIFFFVDQRNTDLAVNMAYAINELQEKNQYTERNMKNYLNFPKNGTPLDNDWTTTDKPLNVNRRWIVEKKDILLIANALQTPIGEESYVNYVNFYEQFEKDYKKFFVDGSIYVDWIGSVSEMHQLVD
tara:strand:- start:9 stop:1076 length:1068 start_codon:yes stop_codon:yes gene_type:complete